MTTKNRMSKTIFLVVAMLFGWMFEAFPATVSMSGFNNIASVLGNCRNGDTISVTGNSTLTKNVVVNKAVTILGNGYSVKKGADSARVTFNADVNVSNLTFDANNISSSQTSFLLIAEGKKVWMDEKTVVKNSANGPVLIVDGTLVGGVITGNAIRQVRNMGIVYVRSNGTIINALIYGNRAEGNNSNRSYIVLSDGGKVINCTIANNRLTGDSGRRQYAPYAYALTSASNKTLVQNTLVCMNTHTNSNVTSDVNVEYNTNLATSQMQSCYVGKNDPGFTNVSGGVYTLLSTSAYVNAGNSPYIREPKDLAGNDRISGGGVDMGAYEYQECATIKASKSVDVVYGEKIILEVDNINSAYDDISISYQWQSSSNGRDWSTIGKDANANRYVIESVSKETPYYRLNILKKGSSEVLCTVNAPVLQFAAPSVKFVASGYDRIVTHYAFEAVYGSTFTCGLEVVNDARITDITLTRKLLQRSGGVATYTAAELENYKYTCDVNESFEFELSYTYQIGTGSSVKKDTSFILRPIYKCTGKKSELIWHDDFGSFDTINSTYTYNKAEGGLATIGKYIVNGTEHDVKYGRNKAFAVPDFNDALQGHRYFSAQGAWHTDDGFYSIVPNSKHSWWGQDQFGEQKDHTKGDGTGGMLVVNCRENSKDTRIYQRDFSVQCDSSLVIFSSYIANLNMWDKATWQANLTLINANVRLDIYEVNETGGEKWLQSAYSGEMLSRLHDYDSDPNVDTYWSNLSAKFLADAGKTYRVVLVNNSNGGAGNDMMFDDITITSCCPDMAISDNPSFVNEKQSVEVCGTDSSDFTIYAIMRDGTVADDYFVSPYFYLYQYREKGEKIWKNFIQEGDPYLDTFAYKVDLTTFPSGAECRAILARSKTRIQQIVTYYNSSYDNASITNEEDRYPAVECAEGVYGVAYGFSISYYPDLGVISADKVKVACPNEPLSFSYDPGDVWVERTWLDADNNVLGTGSSYSFTKSKKEIDVFHYVIAGEGGVCPDTITFEAHVNRDLAFNEVPEIYVAADANCQATISLNGEKPSYSYCATDIDHVDYYYRVNESGAWKAYSDNVEVTVVDNDKISWMGVLFLQTTSAPVDTVFYSQPVHVSDSTAPVIVRCGDMENLYALASKDKVSGDVMVTLSPSVVQNASEDNCTAPANLEVLWNAGSGNNFGAFGSDFTITLNAYTNPFEEYTWKVKDEAGLESDPCYVKYEIKKDTLDDEGDPYSVIRDTVICAGSFPLNWYGRTFLKDGDTAHVGYALLKVFADSSYFRTITETVCDKYDFNGKSYFSTGVYTDVIHNESGCDSVITLNLTINEIANTTKKVTACDSYTWNGKIYDASGIYVDTMKAVTGCDSIATLDLTIGHSFYDTTDAKVANSYTWDVNGALYTRSGQYVSDLKSVHGCDSIHVLNLTIYAPSYGSEDVRICRKDLPYRYAPGFTHMGDTASKLIVSDTVFTFQRYNQGDTIITFNVTILESSSSTFDRAVCRNKFPYEFDNRNGLVVYTPQSDTTFVLSNRMGCDSVITLNLNVLEPSDTTILDKVACDSFHIWGETFTGDTVLTKTFSNAVGCDSSVTLNLKVNHAIRVVENLGSVCDSIEWHGKKYYASNNIDTFKTTSTVTGCDSIVTLNVIINHSVYSNETYRLCPDTFVAASGWSLKLDHNINLYRNPSEPWSVFDTTVIEKTTETCNSYVDVRVIVDEDHNYEEEAFARDSFLWNGAVYKTSGEYTHQEVASSGCKFAGKLTLHIIPTKHEELNVTSCGNYEYLSGGVLYATAKDTTWTLKLEYDTVMTHTVNASAVDTTVMGDSILTIHVKVNPTQRVNLAPAVSCGPTTWNGMDVVRTGFYEYTIPSTVTGCDSTTTIRYFVYDVTRDTVQAMACESYEWGVNGQTYTTSGFYSDTTRFSDASCDSSIVVLDLTILPKSENIIRKILSVSEYENYRVEGFHPDVMDTIKADGLSYPNPRYDARADNYPSIVSGVKNVHQCDSILKFDISLVASSEKTVIRDAVCLADLPYNVTIGSVDYALYNDTAITLKNALGGDSTVAVVLQINSASTPVTEKVEVCGLSYDWNGETYTESTTDTFLTKNRFGCDSIVYLDLKLNKPTYSLEEIAACDSFEWNGTVYDATRLAGQGMADYTFKYALSEKNGQAGVADSSMMLPYYIERENNAAGCDSVVILSLRITKTVYGDPIDRQSCDSFTWLVNEDHPDGIYRTSGVYSARCASMRSNCDSVATINLTILRSVTFDTVLSVCENQPVVFGNLELKGDTSFSVTSAEGCDSLVNVKVVINPVYEYTDVVTVCDSVYTWRGNVYQTSGVYVDSLTTVSCGCDSVYKLDLTLNQMPVVTVDTTVCGRFVWNGISYTESTNFSDTLTSAAGCDSIVVVNLVVETPSVDSLGVIELSAAADCKGELKLDDHKPGFQYCDSAAVVEYRFSTDSITWTNVDGSATVNVANGDTIYWSVRFLDEVGEVATVTASQVVSVADKTAPEFVESCESWTSVYSVFDTISGNVTFSLAADSVRTKMSDNCTETSNLDVQWNVNGAGFSSFVGDTTFTLNAYKGDSITISWKVVDEAGNVSDVCDKVYVIDRDKDGGDSSFYSIIRDTLVCSGSMPLSWYGAEFKNDGDTAHVGSTLLRVHVDKSFFLTDTVVACGSYVWRDGQTYTQSATSTFQKGNESSCDSIYTLNLTILEPSKLDTVLSVESVDLPITLGGSSIDKDTTLNLENIAGCDSIVSIDLRITYRDTLRDSFSCPPYVWNGNPIVEAGVYSDTTVANGDVTIKTLVLDYVPTTVNVALNTCEGMPGVFMGHEIEGDTVLVIPNENKCDVYYSIKLHVTPAFSGDTASVFACHSYSWNGRTLTESGIYRDTISSVLSGCDSVAILDLTISNLPIFGDTLVAYECESYEWAGKTYTRTGMYFDTIPSSIGCDSIIALDLKLGRPDTVSVDTTISVGQSISFQGLKVKDAEYGVVYTYDTAGVSIYGCEIVYHVTINVAGKPIVIDSVEVSGGENGHGGDSIPGVVTVVDSTSISDTSVVVPSVKDSVKVIVKGGLWFCQGDVANVKFFTSGEPETFVVKFDSLTAASGFKETRGTLEDDGLVSFDIPEDIQPGVYHAYVQLFGEGMSSQMIKVRFYVSIGSSVIKRKWNDVLVCSNPDSFFVEYQWYHNNVKLEGETSQYISVLTGVEGNYSLDVVTLYGDTFHICGKDFEMLLPEFSISAYPVPAVANQEFTIQVYGLDKDQLKKAKLVVYSVDGVVMYKDLDGIDEKNKLSLPIGDYVAVVTVENGLSANCKILVKP